MQPVPDLGQPPLIPSPRDPASAPPTHSTTLWISCASRVHLVTCDKSLYRLQGHAFGAPGPAAQPDGGCPCRSRSGRVCDRPAVTGQVAGATLVFQAAACAASFAPAAHVAARRRGSAAPHPPSPAGGRNAPIDRRTHEAGPGISPSGRGILTPGKDHRHERGWSLRRTHPPGQSLSVPPGTRQGRLRRPLTEPRAAQYPAPVGGWGEDRPGSVAGQEGTRPRLSLGVSSRRYVDLRGKISTWPNRSASAHRTRSLCSGSWKPTGGQQR